MNILQVNHVNFYVMCVFYFHVSGFFVKELTSQYDRPTDNGLNANCIVIIKSIFSSINIC